MRTFTDEATIFLGSAVPQADFTAATTDVITSNAHGLSNGDLIQLTTSDTLPAGLSLATNYYVIDATTNTFKVSTTPNGPAVDITTTGTGTHTYHLKGKAIYVGDWKNIGISLNFIDSPTMTVKFQGSQEDDAPDFNAAQSYTNRWDYIEVIDNQDGTAIDGDTGIACSGTADNRLFAANVDTIKWLTVAITAYTAGKLDIRISSFSS